VWELASGTFTPGTLTALFSFFFRFLEMGMPEDYDLTINAALPIIQLCTISASEANMVLATLKVS
jgi:hypothetical protein